MNEENEKSGNMGWRCGPRRWFLYPLIAIAGVLLFAAIVMWLWNALIPAIFTSVGAITYCQAIGILILSKILFGCGFRGRRGHCCHRGGWRHRGLYWKQKWMNMSEEEKAKFKEEWKKRCEPEGPCE